MGPMSLSSEAGHPHHPLQLEVGFELLELGGLLQGLDQLDGGPGGGGLFELEAGDLRGPGPQPLF